MCHKQLETNFPNLTKEFGNINKDKKFETSVNPRRIKF